MKATVLITTKNRKDDLLLALRSALKQTANPEIIVIDDGSSDGTHEMVKTEFPQVHIYSHEQSKGYIISRNEGASLASGEVIFSIDDDAEFSTPHVIEQTLNDFSDPWIGALAIPYIEPHKADVLLQKAPEKEGIWLTDRFIGTAHALRRDLFLKLGGYRENLIHQGEEGDFCIRMLNHGLYVRMGTADPIIHHESPKRSYERMDYYGCRNNILFLWQNVPWSFLPIYLFGSTINCVKWTLVPRRLFTRIKGLFAGYFNFLKTSRSPVSVQTFEIWRSLGKSALTLGEIKTILNN